MGGMGGMGGTGGGDPMAQVRACLSARLSIKPGEVILTAPWQPT